jgi:hypothetical protein
MLGICTAVARLFLQLKRDKINKAREKDRKKAEAEEAAEQARRAKQQKDGGLWGWRGGGGSGGLSAHLSVGCTGTCWVILSVSKVGSRGWYSC